MGKVRAAERLEGEESRSSFGNVRQLPSGRFQARFTRGETPHNAPSTFATRAAAERWLRHAGTDLDRGDFIDHRKGATLFGPYGRALLEQQKLSYRATTRIKVDLTWRRYIAPYFADATLAELEADPARFRQWAVTLSAELERPLAPATVQFAGQLIGRVMRAAVADRLISTDPTAAITWPRPGRSEMETLSVAEVDALAAAIDPRYRTLVLVACYAGLRIGELVALTVGDVNPLAATVTVSKSCSELNGSRHHGAPKTAAGYRTVPLPRWLADELALEFAGRHRDDIAFPAPKGDFVQLTNFRRMFWSPAVRAIGREGFRIHDMRHTAVSLWIAAGIDPKRIATWAGHTSVAFVLDRYGHLFAGQDTEAVDRLEALVAARRAEAAAESSKVVALHR